MLRNIIDTLIKTDKYSKKITQSVIEKLYIDIVAISRQPIFYTLGGVSDTPSGRFELLIVHISLVCLYMESGNTDRTHMIAQGLHDRLIMDLDRALREMGTGDLSVKRKIRRLAEAFHGRMRAYEMGLGDCEGEILEDAICRNILGYDDDAQEKASCFAAYIRSCDTILKSSAPEDYVTGNRDLAFPAADTYF